MAQIEYQQPDLWDAAASTTPAPASEAAAQGPDASQLWLSRECVRLDTLTDDERVALQARSDARGVREWDARIRRTVKRSAAEAAGLQSLCEWFNGHGLDILCTFTFSDEVAESRGIYSLARAIEDVRRGLRSFDLGPGYRPGFENRFVLAGEWHPSGRKVPHVHGVLESGSLTDTKLCRHLWAHFFANSGRCRFEPMRDVDTATLYGLKDTLKACGSDPHSMSMRLSRKRTNKRSRPGARRS